MTSKMLISKPVEFNDPDRVQSILEVAYKRSSLNITCSQLFTLGFFFPQFYVHWLEHCKFQSFRKAFRKSLQILQKVKNLKSHFSSLDSLIIDRSAGGFLL